MPLKKLLKPVQTNSFRKITYIGRYGKKLIVQLFFLSKSLYFIEIQDNSFMVNQRNCGAEDGTRTHTLLRAADFESAASTNSATSA